MLSRTLVLAVIWLAFSAVATLLRGVQLRHGGAMRSTLWLATVILCGDVWALLTFGQPLEIAVLSLIAFVHGLWWIRHLPNWNGLGQAMWSFSILATLLYLLYNFAVTAFTPLHPLGFVLSCLLFFVELLALGMSLSFTYETLDVCTRLRWRHESKASRKISRRSSAKRWRAYRVIGMRRPPSSPRI